MFCRGCGAGLVATASQCPRCGTAANAISSPASSGLVIWGWISAFLMPLLGIIIGIITCVKGRVGTGIGMIFLSICMWGFWAGFFEALNAG